MTLRRLGQCAAAGAAVVTIAALAWLRMGPIDESLLAARTRSVTVLDRHGEVLYETAGAGGTRAEALHADALPERVVRATIAAEDRRFYRHSGIDPMATARAFVHNVKAMRVVEGGSTISQQVAKLLLQSRDRSLRQKAREAVLALRLEHRHSKRELLAMYLNLAPYGNRLTGAARASRAYFGVEASRLTDAQAAFLAALPQKPTTFNPLRDPSKARARQLYILAAMELDDADFARAKEERLMFSRVESPAAAMHFVERVLKTNPREGTSVRTTLDGALQRDVRGIIAMQKETLLRHGAHSVAVAVLDNRTGEWLAWEGSGDYFGGNFGGANFGGAIDGVSALRQPGSALKPFTYAVAFENGQTPATVLPDIPSHFPTAEQGVLYTPRNYDGRYRGPMPVRMALAGSQNVPAVAMLTRIGPEALLRFLRNSGFASLDKTADYYGLGLTLGGAEVSLEQLVTAYATFARGGIGVTPVMLHGAKQPAERRMLAPRTAFWITDILADADAREYAFGSGGSLDLPFTVAVKTGTSQAYRDNWTVGYTRDLTVGVWVGNFDRQPLRGSSGVMGAAPIFNAVMLAAVKRVRGELPIGDRTPILEPPADVEQLSVCALSGERPTQWCADVRTESLPVSAPARFCSWHHDGAISWPAEYREWARRNAPSTPVTEQKIARAETFGILNPADGATFLIDPTLRSEFQTVRLRAASAAPVQWIVGDRRLPTPEWPLARGIHTITAVDASGRRDSVKVFVK